jgi:RNA polymerase sigma factor (sigma-70 family)
MRTFEDIKGLLYSFAEEMRYQHEELDELVAEIWIAAQEQEGKGNRTETLFNCHPKNLKSIAQRSILDYRRKYEKSRCGVTKKITMAGEMQDYIAEQLTAPDDPAETVANKDFYENAIKSVTKIQGLVLKSRYNKGRTFKEIGEEFGKSEGWASLVHKAAIESLKAKFGGDYEGL